MAKVYEPDLYGQTGKSEELYLQAKEVIPGGVTANIKFFEPHPIMMERGQGSKLYDVDGNEYIDYLLCYGALILGHGHKRVYDAVFQQMRESGTTIFGTPHVLETKMAQKLVEIIPGLKWCVIQTRALKQRCWQPGWLSLIPKNQKSPNSKVITTGEQTIFYSV